MATDDLDVLFDVGLPPSVTSPTIADYERLYARIRAISPTGWRTIADPDDDIRKIRIRFDNAIIRDRVVQTINGEAIHQSIPGTFMLQPSDEKAQPVGDPVGPLSFKDTVAALIADYDASSHQAHGIVSSAARNETSDLMSDLTHKGVRITYSA